MFRPEEEEGGFAQMNRWQQVPGLPSIVARANSSLLSGAGPVAAAHPPGNARLSGSSMALPSECYPVFKYNRASLSVASLSVSQCYCFSLSIPSLTWHCPVLVTGSSNQSSWRAV